MQLLKSVLYFIGLTFRMKVIVERMNTIVMKIPVLVIKGEKRYSVKNFNAVL